MWEWGNSPKPTESPAAPISPQPIAASDHPVLPLADDKAYMPVGGYQGDLSQAEVDKLDPIQRALRGLGHVHQALFDKGTGENPLTKAGDLLTAGGSTVIAPIEIGANTLSHVPLSWATGADTAFEQVGAYMKQHDPGAYQNWLAVKAHADSDVLGGGNLKADFNEEAAKYYDKFNKEGTLGANPMLSVGAQGTGSLGGVLSHFLQGVWNVGSSNVQGFLGNAGVFDPGQGHIKSIRDAIAIAAKAPEIGDATNGRGLSPDAQYAVKQYQSGAFTEQQANDYLAKNDVGGRSRIQESIARFQRGDETSALEQEAITNVQSGRWSEKHANDYLIAGGQSITRNPIGQIAGGLVTDPTLLLMGGAGAAAKAAKVGTDVLESGLAAESAYQKLGVTLAKVTTNPVLGPIAKAGRGIIDPFQLIPVSTVTKGLRALFNGAAVDALGSAMGHNAIREVRDLARVAGKGTEVDTALASISHDRGNELAGISTRDNALREELGNELVHSPVDVEAVTSAAPKDVVVRLSDYITKVRKYVFTPEDMAALSGRVAKAFGGDATQWLGRINKMSRDTVSTLHMTTHKLAETDFVVNALNKIDKPNYTGDLPLPELTLLNPQNIDNVTAQALLDEQAGLSASIKSSAEAWNKAALQYDEIAQIGHATGNKDQLAELVTSLKNDLEQGQFHKRVLDEELTHPSLAPIVDFLDRNTIDGERLWNVGFRPAQDVSWGLKADRVTGKWIAGRTPSIDHTIDAVYQGGFSDTTRNLIGQIIPDSVPNKLALANKLNRPVDVLESFAKTATDVVSGRRLVLNVEQRFHTIMAEDLGIPKAISKDVWRAVSDVAALNRTTVRGLPINESVMGAIEKVLPADLVQSGELNLTRVMDALLVASEGDMRIMGVTSKLTQQMRNSIRRAVPGFRGNALGELTVTQYNRFRYIQPTFLIQKVTDAPYFMGLHGIMPVGTGELTPTLTAVRRIEENMGFTQTARDFAFDYPERAIHSNWGDGIRDRLSKIVNGDVTKLDAIQGNLPGRAAVDNQIDRYVANNMTKDLSTRTGSIVREALDEIDGLLKDHPEMAAELNAQRDLLHTTMADWRAEYSRTAGRVLNDDETGLKLIQENFASARRVKAVKGGIDTEAFHHEMTLSMPADFGEVHTIYPEQLAAEMNFPNAKALREAINGVYNPTTQQVEKGVLGIDRFKENLREQFGADPAYIDRAARYFGGTWDSYFGGLARPIGEGGLDLTSRSVAKAQDMIRVWAKDRGMDPWEYLSQVVGTNLGAEGLDTHIQKLVNFFDKGATEQIGIDDIMAFFKGHMDLSAQKSLIENYTKTLPRAIRPATAEAYAASRPAVKQAYSAAETGFGDLATNGPLGPGLRALPPDKAAPIIDALNAFHEQAPGIHVNHIDVVKLEGAIERAGTTPAASLSDANRSTVLLNESHFAQEGADFGKGYVADATPEGAVNHELSHMLIDQSPAGGAFEKFGDRFIKAIDSGAVQVSGYSKDAVTGVARREEALAELGSRMLGPADRVPAEMLPWVEEIRQSLQKDGTLAATAVSSTDQYFTKVLPEQIRARALSGVADANPEIEAHFQQWSKFTQQAMQGAQTQNELRMLTASIPTGEAAPFNRFESLLQQTLHDKIRLAQQDVFMLAEMATNRNVLMRSVNHPFFGIYPASYMWGKVLPATARALAKNPYGLTYGINQVQRSVATQREYDPAASIPKGVDKSAVAFLLGYLTPSLPWETMQAQTPPWYRQIQKGDFNPFDLLDTEFHTMDPHRWYGFFEQPVKEIGSALSGSFKPQTPDAAVDDPRLQSFVQQQPGGAAATPAVPGPTGPTKGTELSPILADEMEQLQRVLSGR